MRIISEDEMADYREQAAVERYMKRTGKDPYEEEVKRYQVHFSIRSSIMIEAKSEEEARKRFLDPDETPTEDLLKALDNNIADMGNDVININDIYED